jgi:hypothetical protein
MIAIWLTILFYFYLFVVRRNETVDNRGMRGCIFEMFPHKKNGMWRWQEYWWVDVLFYIPVMVLFVALSYIFL